MHTLILVLQGNILEQDQDYMEFLGLIIEHKWVSAAVYLRV